MNPKLRFLASDQAKPFGDMAVDQTLLTAIEYAMLEMVKAEGIGDERSAMAAGYRFDGARKFVDILLSLANAPAEKKRSITPMNLPEP